MVNVKINARVLCSNPLELGGKTAFTEVPASYKGNCMVKGVYDEKIIAVLPNAKEAESVACYACSRDGGFDSTIIVPAPKMAATHSDFESWVQ
jgi:hypothetical protein